MSFNCAKNKRTRTNSNSTSNSTSLHVGRPDDRKKSPKNNSFATTYPVEQKDEENQQEILEKLCEALSTDHKLVWYRTTSKRHIAGHIIAEHRTSVRNVYLIKTMTNKLLLLDDRYIIDGVPHLNFSDVQWLMRNLRNLTSEFEVRANIIVITEEWGLIRSTQKKTPYEIVVQEWQLPVTSDSSFVKVKNAEFEWTSCPITSLKISLPTLVVGASADTEALQRCNAVLEQTESENRDLQAELERQRTRNESLKTTISKERRNHQRKMSEISEQQSESERRISALQTSSSKKDNRIRILDENAESNRSDIEQLKRAKQRKESELRVVREQLLQQRTEADTQANESQKKIDQLRTTITAYEQTQVAQKQEILTLRDEADRNYRQVRQLEDILPVFERQQELLVAERQKNDDLQREVDKQSQKLAELLGRSLISIYSGLNFCGEMAELRNEKHDEAVDACEDLHIPQEKSLDLLFRIFMFCYDYFEGKLVQLRSMLNLDGNENLERLFIIKMQDNYKAMFDADGLTRAYLETFSQELAHGCADRRIMAYVLACGELCWSVVLHLPKLQFLPRERLIDPEEEVMFEADKFKDFAGSVGKNGKARVVSYVLPGLYRLDSDVAIGKDALPYVFTKKIRRVDSLVKPKLIAAPVVVKPPVTKASVPRKAAEVDTQELLEDIETDVWNGDVADAEEKLRALRWSTSSVKILCGDEDCDAVLFSDWKNYQRAVADGVDLQCPIDDAHDGVRIHRKW